MRQRLVVCVVVVIALLLAVPIATAPLGAAPVHTPSSKDQCKNDGWRALTDDNGNPFPNQGQCGSWVIHHPRPPAGLGDLAGSFSFTGNVSFVGQFPGCGGDIHQVFDVAYPGSTAVGAVTLHVGACLNPVLTSLAGTFAISTNMGALSGAASGPITFTAVIDLELSLTVTSATGAFQGAAGVLHTTLIWDGPPSLVVTGSVTAA